MRPSQPVVMAHLRVGADRRGVWAWASLDVEVKRRERAEAILRTPRRPIPWMTSRSRRDTRRPPPQRVGVVSGVLSTNVDGQETLFGDVVSKRFGPQNENDDRELPPQRLTGSEFGDDEAEAPSRVDTTQSTGRDRLRALASLFPDDPAMLELEVDPMAHIGRATPRTKGRGLGAHSVALNRLGPAARRRRSRRRCGSSRRYESGLPAKRGRR